MQELIDKITANAGITADQAKKTLDTIKEYIVEKFPMLEGAVENMFASPGGSASSSDAVE